MALHLFGPNNPCSTMPGRGQNPGNDITTCPIRIFWIPNRTTQRKLKGARWTDWLYTRILHIAWWSGWAGKKIDANARERGRKRSCRALGCQGPRLWRRHRDCNVWTEQWRDQESFLDDGTKYRWRHTDEVCPKESNIWPAKWLDLRARK